MPKSLKDFEPGDRVLYVPYHAQGKKDHKDCEWGKVSSVKSTSDGLTIFVKFDEAVAFLGWDGATACGCRPDQLVRQDE